MRVKNCILSLAVIVSIVAALLSPININASEFSATEKADVLNKLSLIKGEGNDYNLGGLLKRLEAATVIVRFIGKEEYVIARQDYYKDTSFPDVKSSEWYAPYVGFCAEQNIVGGYLDGKFGPNDTTTEKAFLKLMLGALDYKEGTDFTWDNVYQVAHSIGLVNGEGYKDRKQDNTSFTREQVVNILYNSLFVKKKDSNIPVIQEMISQGKISKQDAESAGLINDEVSTEIRDIEVLGDNNISVKFNESLQDISDADVQVYESSNQENKLNVSVESQVGSEVILKTSVQTPDVNYTVAISNITDQQGNPTECIKGTFVGYRNPDLKSDFFRVSKVLPISKNMVSIYFTQPVSTNSELPYNYSIYKDDKELIAGSFRSMKVRCAGSGDNIVAVYLTDDVLADGTDYTMKVSGTLCSKYGAKLNEGMGDSIRFTGKESSLASLKVMYIRVLDSKTIEVELNKEVDSYYAQQFMNYQVTDSNSNMVTVNKAVVYNDALKKGKLIHIGVADELEHGEKYNLFIKHMEDSFGEDSISEQTQSFTATYSTTRSNLFIVSARALDKGTIEVNFNRSLDPSSASKAEEYSITGISDSSFDCTPVKVCYEPDKNNKRAILYLPKDKLLKSSKTYKLMVFNGIKDELGNEAQKGMEDRFSGTNSDYKKPTVKKATIISEDSVKVELSREISADMPNLLASNYLLQYRIDGFTASIKPLFVGYIDSTTVVLKFENLDSKTKYTLKFSELKDYAGNNSRTTYDGDNTITVEQGE